MFIDACRRSFIALLLVLCGCSKMGPMKESYNAALDDSLFRQTFANKTIEGVLPASGVPAADLQKLRALALNIHIPEDIMGGGMVYLANSDQKRLAFLEKALLDKHKHVIVWPLRGGYGSARLIEGLKSLPKPIHQNTFVGFSDMTALHLFLSQAWGWKTIHGSGLQALLKPEQDSDNFLKIASIVGGAKQSTIEDLQPMNPQAIALKQVKGLLTGGNLTLVQTSIGTPWQIQSQDKILFLEDTSEKGYKLDRAFTQLRQAGVFKGVKAIVLGQFEENDLTKADVQFALERFAKETAIPVFKCDAFGHGLKNYPLVYNSEASIRPVKAAGVDKPSFELLMQF